MYSRLKDDILVATKSLKKGITYYHGKLIQDDQKKLDDNDKTPTKITMEVLKDNAEDVDEMFKFTIDTPCNYEDGMNHALEIKVCINEV